MRKELRPSVIDLRSDQTDFRSSTLDVLWSLSLRPDVLCCSSLRWRRRRVDVLGSFAVDEVFFSLD